MTCISCVSKVKSELLKLSDVISADVQLNTPQATISMQRHIAVSDLQRALIKAGPNYIIAEADATMNQSEPEAKDGEQSYFPVFLIFGYILGVSLTIQFVRHQFDVMQWMSHFMAAFFLVFSFFKLMNLKGFAEGYSTYDIVAKKSPVYGFVYPFIELLLGVAFLTQFNPMVTNVVTLIVMGVSTIGVIQSLLKKSHFQCACLGTIIKLPLSSVTLFEDMLMTAMSCIMLILI